MNLLDKTGLTYFWGKIKSKFLTNVAWDSTNKKITKTLNGTTSDVVTGATILSGMTKSQVTAALGYTPPTTDTMVTQTATDSTDATYELLFSGSANNTTGTEGARKSQYAAFNPSKKAFTFGTRLSGSTVGNNSTAEGSGVTASGPASHAEGRYTIADGFSAHAEGTSTEANGNYSHSEGNGSIASGQYSHAEGNNTIANHASQHVFGEYNVADDSTAASTAHGKYIEIVGKGTNVSRSNARTLDWNGNEWLAGNLTVNNDILLENDTWDGVHYSLKSALRSLKFGSLTDGFLIRTKVQDMFSAFCENPNHLTVGFSDANELVSTYIRATSVGGCFAGQINLKGLGYTKLRYHFTTGITYHKIYGGDSLHLSIGITDQKITTVHHVSVGDAPTFYKAYKIYNVNQYAEHPEGFWDTLDISGLTGDCYLYVCTSGWTVTFDTLELM